MIMSDLKNSPFEEDYQWRTNYLQKIVLGWFLTNILEIKWQKY